MNTASFSANVSISAVPSTTATSSFNPAPSLGPLATFLGTWTGPGFNTIFRPNSPVTPTPLPLPASGPDDNILQLNITDETIAFSPSLGSVPNRAMLAGQPDIFLNGVPYLQTVNDVTTPGQSVGIHFEPGIWLIVPPTTNPGEPQSLARLASIPHGTTILAQGTSLTFPGPPPIAPVDITPFVTGSNPPQLITFPSQTAADNNTFRIPQTLPSTITQTMLDDPNSVLRDAIQGQNIISTTTLFISTMPDAPLFGGGADNIAFLEGNPGATNPNANAIKMTAIFWLETVQNSNGSTFQQIQYTQTVFLDFNGLTWPHVSVATLVQTKPHIYIRTPNGRNFLTVTRDGGITNPNAPIQSFSRTVGPNEKFTIDWINQAAGTFALKTANGNYLSVVGGGGHSGPNRTALPIHSNAVTPGNKATMLLVPQADGSYALQTDTGFFLTATNGGGLSDSVVETTQTSIGQNETLTMGTI